MQDAVQQSFLVRTLASRETQASTPEGASAITNDPTLLNIVIDALKRPASGTNYTQWVGSLELRKAVRTGAKLLQYCGETKETAGIARSIIAAAQAALPLQPETSATIANVLSQAEQDLSGKSAFHRNIGQSH